MLDCSAEGPIFRENKDGSRGGYVRVGGEVFNERSIPTGGGDSVVVEENKEFACGFLSAEVRSRAKVQIGFRAIIVKVFAQQFFT